MNSPPLCCLTYHTILKVLCIPTTGQYSSSFCCQPRWLKRKGVNHQQDTTIIIPTLSHSTYSATIAFPIPFVPPVTTAVDPFGISHRGEPAFACDKENTPIMRKVKIFRTIGSEKSLLWEIQTRSKRRFPNKPCLHNKKNEQDDVFLG